jgi:hypothetical protein
VFVTGTRHPDVRVPFREIELSPTVSHSGTVEVNEPVRVYDTSGPQDHDVSLGLPKLRSPWVGCRRTDACVTQLHYARKGDITPGWYRHPEQRDFKVCYNSIWRDRLVAASVACRPPLRRAPSVVGDGKQLVVAAVDDQCGHRWCTAVFCEVLAADPGRTHAHGRGRDR